MLIIDILIYVFFAFYASSLAKKSEEYVVENNLDPDKWDKYLTYFVLFFTVIVGIRWNVGSDCLSYAVGFDRVKPDLSINKELLWTYIIIFIQKIGLHWTFGLALCGFLQFYFITKTVEQFRWLLIFIPFVLFGGRYWQDLMGAVRQMIVATAFLWASRFIFERKMLKYFLFVAIGSLIHQSALLLAPFYFFPTKLNLTNKRTVLIIILLLCIVIGQTPAFQSLAGYIEFIAETTNYEDKAEGLVRLVSENNGEEALSFGPMMLSYLLIPIFIIWFGPRLREKYGDKIPYFELWYNLAYLYACVYFLVCNVSHYFVRPTLYFSLFQMVMAALLLQYLWTDFKTHGVRQAATYTFCAIIALNSVWDIYKVSGMAFEIKTYKVFFMHDDQRKRLGL